MNNQLWGMLNASEQELLRAVDKDALAGLDEDRLAELHDRVRRARNKYTKLYRRRAGAQVARKGTRAGAHEQNARTAGKAEVFEDALARVSRALAAAANQAARELRAERLAAARGTGTSTRKAPARNRTAVRKKPPSAPVKRKTPATKRARAATRATTARTQARRDSR
jgi:hypothetical protein